MSIALAKKYAPYTDDLFKAESKISLLTNQDFDWTGARSVLVWKVGTVALTDYSRSRGSDYDESEATLSRYGKIIDLDAQTEEMLLSNDKSFIFNIDRLDEDETAGQVAAASALARELREQVVPFVDTYTYNVMVTKAGTKATAAALTKENVYDSILEGSEALDDEEVPDTDRVMVVPPSTYTLLKQADLFDSTEVGAEMRLKGVVGILDGMTVVKVPKVRLPQNFGFMIAHPSATVAPVKLEDYGTHPDTALSSGTIVTGRICFDAFVLDNKAKGIYYHPIAATE